MTYHSSLVSVCIPVHNAENYIADTIKSVLDQTYENIEIIIVDDGSTDQSSGIAQRYANANNHIKIFSQSNSGASTARNKCLSEAKGEYIQFLDADDLLSTDKIYEQVSLLKKSPGMIAVCNTVHFNDKEDHLHYAPSAYEEAFLIDAAPVHFLINLYGGFADTGSMIQPNAWLTPRNIIEKVGPWNEELTLDDDGEYFCRVLLKSRGIIKSKGYNYYRKYTQSKNLSSSQEKKHLESQYKSLKLKVSNLMLYAYSLDIIKKIEVRWLNDLRFRAYPTYPDLVMQLDKDIADLQYNYIHKYPFGTSFGKISCKLLGWQIAKRLQIFKQSLK